MQVKRIKKKELIVGLLILILIGLLSFLHLDKNKDILIKDNIENLNTNKVAIYIQQNGEYVESTLPTSGYTLNKDLSGCKVSTTTSGIKNAADDKNITIEYSNGKLNFLGISKNNTRCYIYLDEKEEGITVLATINGVSSNIFPSKTSNYIPTSVSCTEGTAKFDYAKWTVAVGGADDTTCTVNFTEKPNQYFNTYLTSSDKVCKKTSENLTDAEAVDCLVNENGYRYEGEDPNNYVLFNDELWRIIGVFTVTNSSGKSENLVKIIRNETLDALAWHSTNSYTNLADVELQKTLNDGYLNAKNATCYIFGAAYSGSAVTKTCKFSKNGIKDEARAKIENVVWNAGIVGTDLTPDAVYTAERSGTNATWIWKIGLMYASDYGYGVLAKNCSRSTGMGSYSICASKNWLNKSAYEWLMTRGGESRYGLYIQTGGSLTNQSIHAGYNIEPTLYLKSSVQIIGGTGTYDLPYIIN